MADVPQRLDLGLGKADPDEYFRRLALYSYAVAPLFPGRKAEGQYVPGLRQYATGGRILEDEFPTAYMPHVGRQVMQEGGAPSFEGDVSFAPADMQADAARMEQENRAASDAARAQARQAYSVSPVVDMGINRALRYAERENAPRAMPTAHEFVQRELGRGEPQLPQYDREAVERMKSGAEGVAHMAAYGIPVVGEVLGAYDMANALRNVASPEFRKAVTSGDYATTAGGLADIGLSAFGIPGKAAKAAAAAGAFLLPDDAQSAIFGEAAKMSPQIRSALEAAKAALAGGAKPAETWQKYGWAPDPAGKMVSELSDAPARLIPSGLQRFRSGENMTLGEILSHPEYYDLYPSMYTTKLYSELPRDERVRGFYNQMTDTLHASSRLDDRALLGNLLHEPSHRMQIIERMSPGSDPALFENPFQRTVEDREDLASLYGAEIIRNFVAQNPGMKPLDAAKILRQQNIPLGPQPVKFTSLAPEAAEETKKLLQSKIEDTFRKYPDPNYQYKMSLGEVVARLPGERIGMSEAERRAAFPLADENIIVRPPHPRQIENVASPEWERDRAQALELSRQLQREPLPPEIPSKFQIETTDAEEELMRLAQQLEAQKRAGKAFLSGKAGGGGVKSAIKMLGKLLPEGSGYAGTPGKPSLVNLPGIGKVEARPIPEVESAASRYMQTIGRPGEHEVASFPEFNPEFATKVADAFAEMKHRPGDPAVRRAYDALIDETMAQYRAAKDTGIDFRFLKEGQADPYAASPALGYEDIVNRGRLFVFPTEQGFGSSGGLIADNPLLRRAGKVGDKPDAVINDAFRIVHDLYGHFGPGNPFFRAPGEERAYQLHSRMFGKEALPAATLETRGQNSWVNYGPYGEANRSAPGATTHFAEQKIGRMPEWTQAPAPAVGEDVEAYIRSLTGKSEGGEIERESFEKGGIIGAAKKIISQYADPPSKYISDWTWRPIEQVAKDINITEVPPHVQNFGNHMADMAEKAQTEGLDPEDLIKAYMITRSSIQREGRTPEKISSYGIPVRQTTESLIRPEGHMADFLSSPMGVRFLNEARKGEISQDPVDAAIAAMRPFGLSKTEPDAMDWSRRNLSGQAGRVSDLVSRAFSGVSPSSEWRDFTKDVRGIGPAKAGFLGSLLGRGDLPTLDARQAILHTGLKNAEAQKLMSAKSGRAGDEAVDRLAARQRAFNLDLPENLNPFYQHLAHHSVWDAIGNERTTHQDIIDAMSPRAFGGRTHFQNGGGTANEGQETFGIVDQALNILSKFNPVGTAEAGPFTKILRDVAEKYRPHYDPNAMVEGMPKSKWISNVALSRPIGDMSVTTKSNRTMLPGLRLDPQDVAGEALISGLGDRTPAGYVVTHLNDRKLRNPVDMRGGPAFAQDEAAQIENAYWGSNRSRAAALANKGVEAANAGYTPTFMYVNQSPQGQDFSHMMTEMVLGQLDKSKMDPNLVEKFDDIMRNLEPKPGLAPLPNFPGITSPRLRNWLMTSSEGGAGRAKMAKVMDKSMFLKDPGFADIGAARFATTDPKLMNIPSFSAGHMISRMDPEGLLIKSPKVPHPSYDTLIASPGGRPGYRGGFEYPLPPEVHYDDYLSGRPSMREGADAPLQTGIRSDLVDKPFAQKTMSLLRETPTVVATPKWVDMASEFQEIMRGLYGRR